MMAYCADWIIAGAPYLLVFALAAIGVWLVRMRDAAMRRERMLMEAHTRGLPPPPSPGSDMHDAYLLTPYATGPLPVIGIDRIPHEVCETFSPEEVAEWGAPRLPVGARSDNVVEAG